MLFAHETPFFHTHGDEFAMLGWFISLIGLLLSVAALRVWFKRS